LKGNPALETLVDNAEPVTFGQLAARFSARGLTAAAYQHFNLPLSFNDIMDPNLADEIVGYRALIDWFNVRP
jgi:hypothetical protein